VIARLEGVLREQQPTRVLIDVGGVGYEVHVPLSTFTELPDPGTTVVLQIYTHAHDGALQLFGFHSAAERVAFELLLRANRVGPRLAQTILSGISPVELLEAIRGDDVRTLRAVPGIGTKMAQRILLELRDRVEDLAAVTALLNLGYPRTDAERVIADAAQEAGSEATLETLVRAALKRLVR
jgi:Holliday junction DNA helicase RuvA